MKTFIKGICYFLTSLVGVTAVFTGTGLYACTDKNILGIVITATGLFIATVGMLWITKLIERMFKDE